MEFVNQSYRQGTCVDGPHLYKPDTVYVDNKRMPHL